MYIVCMSQQVWCCLLVSLCIIIMCIVSYFNKMSPLCVCFGIQSIARPVSQILCVLCVFVSVYCCADESDVTVLCVAFGLYCLICKSIMSVLYVV